MSENTLSGLDAAEAFFSTLEADSVGATRNTKPDDNSEVEGDEPEARDDESDETPDDTDEVDADADDESAAENDDDTTDDSDDDSEGIAEEGSNSKAEDEKEVEHDRLRYADYTKKSQALAEERKTFEAEYEILRQERAYYREHLPLIAQIVTGPQTSQQDLEYLRQHDPEGYTRAWIANQEAEKSRATLEAERERLEQAETVEQAEAFRAHVASQKEVLLQARPEWKDPKVFAKAQKDMRDFARTVLNYSEEEINQTADARAVLALDLAVRAHRASNMKGEPVKSSARRVAPGSANATPRKSSATDEAMKRQLKNGSLSNTADALRHLI